MSRDDVKHLRHMFNTTVMPSRMAGFKYLDLQSAFVVRASHGAGAEYNTQ